MASWEQSFPQEPWIPVLVDPQVCWISWERWIPGAVDPGPGGSRPQWIPAPVDPSPGGSQPWRIPAPADPGPGGSQPWWILTPVDLHPDGSWFRRIPAPVDPGPGGSRPGGSRLRWIPASVDSGRAAMTLSRHRRAPQPRARSGMEGAPGPSALLKEIFYSLSVQSKQEKTKIGEIGPDR